MAARFRLLSCFFGALFTVIVSSPPAHALGRPKLKAPRAPLRCAAPKILTRAAWGAHAPVLPMRPQVPTAFVIHHSGEPQNRRDPFPVVLRSLQHFSQTAAPLSDGRRKPVWADLPYHYLVAWDGQIAEGRSVDFAGDTNTTYDPRGFILIEVDGNFETGSPTAAQLDSVARLIAYLGAVHGIPVERTTGHRDHAVTDCPGKFLYADLGALVTRARSICAGDAR